MKLYLECNMGAAGDMLMAALLELLPDRDSFLQKMNGLGIPGVRIECVPSEKCGITGSHIHVLINDESETAHDISLASDAVEPHAPSHQHEHPHDHCHEHSGHEHSGHEHTADGGQAHSHHHFSCADIRGIISSLDLPEKVKADALAVYRIIGEAESDVHGVPVEQIHFHEVGSMDAVVDVVGCCLLIYLLGVTEITASPVHVGSGFVRCAHGILPVPAPATANILKGIPVYGGTIKGELCTPTGAALLRHYVSRFGEMGPMSVTDIGYGMGSKNFEAANCVRAFLGDMGDQHDEIIDISCNLDDMTPEAMGSVYEILFENGALDVYATPIYMKKNRPSYMFTCLCKPSETEKLSKLMLIHTTTLGVRISAWRRNKLSYSFSTVETIYGPIRVKSVDGGGVRKEKPEYEDIKTAARKFSVPFGEVYQQAIIETAKNKAKDQRG